MPMQVVMGIAKRDQSFEVLGIGGLGWGCKAQRRDPEREGRKMASWRVSRE
jgi:hypothetical protein